MERIRSLFRWSILGAGLLLLLLNGCASPGRNLVGPTTMQIAQSPYPSDELLSVGIEIFDAGNVDPKVLEEQHSSQQIRDTEVQFMPYHLKTTLEQSGFWGEVRVVPKGAKGLDVKVSGTVLESHGEELALEVYVEDAQGYVWIDRVYRDRLAKEDYEQILIGKRGPFQNIYNAIANDIATVRRRMDPLAVKQLRRTTQLLFAADLVPGAYDDYVIENDQGKREVVRLPAEDDPMWQRVNQISVRNAMFFDALNNTYDPFYRKMWTPYVDWRRYNLVEQISIREARGESIKKAVAGLAMIAAAVLLEVYDVDDASTIRDVLIIGGTQVVINGVNISQRADIHRETLKELSDSFSSDAKTILIELEGQTVALTGTVGQQMAQWQDLLRQMYQKEQTFPDTDLSDE
ncbi:hypothetical protein P0Y35_13235 [Kiritimatiellaeota bacterium B1221]|nr:hypothetical protein [Kiritimatiellaeota bacterium B1221]